VDENADPVETPDSRRRRPLGPQFVDVGRHSSAENLGGCVHPSPRDALLVPSRKDPFRTGDFEEIVGRVHESIRVPKRNFPGDKDFHYHVLRHSLANALLLKLSPALHPVARRILHRHPLTRQWISNTERFRKDLFGTTQIRGTDPEEARRLAETQQTRRQCRLIPMWSKTDERSTSERHMKWN